GPKWIGLWLDFDFHAAKLIRKPERECRRHFDSLDFQVRANFRDDLRGTRELRSARLPSLLIFGIRKHFIDAGLTLRAIDLEVVHDEISFSARLNEGERIGRKEVSGPEHVRIAVTCTVDETGLGSCRFGHVILGGRCPKPRESLSSVTKFFPARRGMKIRL